tara:strand:+ start:355 stop:798 length:444 start_codon:yes stop_codon:yes gene_type:complete
LLQRDKIEAIENRREATMAVTFNDIKKKKAPLKECLDSTEDLDIFKKEKTLRPWETFEEKKGFQEKDLLDEINERLDFEKQTSRKKRLVKKDFVKVPPLTHEEKEEKKRKAEEKLLVLEENKKPGISPELEKRLKKAKNRYFDSILQ